MTAAPTEPLLAAHTTAAELLLHAPIRRACLDAYLGSLPAGVQAAGIATVLACHPNRSSTVFTAAYQPELPYDLARGLLLRAALTPGEAAHAIATEARRADGDVARRLLAEVLLTTGPLLADHVLDDLTTAAGATPTTGTRAEREQHAADACDMGTVYRLTSRVRELYDTKCRHDAGRLSWPAPTAPALDVPLPGLQVTDLPATGQWLAHRIGTEPAAWTLLATVITPTTTVANLAATVTAVLAPAAGVRSRATTRPRRWWRRLLPTAPRRRSRQRAASADPGAVSTLR